MLPWKDTILPKGLIHMGQDMAIGWKKNVSDILEWIPLLKDIAATVLVSYAAKSPTAALEGY